MIKHRLLIIWIIIYIIILFLCLGLLLNFEAIRIRIAILLVGLIFSFIFYPIYIFDKRNSKRAIKVHKSKTSKILTADLNELEKKKEDLLVVEQGSQSQENTEKKTEIYCNFCGKKVDEDVKLCPYCGTDL